MRIFFERSGGFAGLRLSRSFDAEQLPAEEVQALQDEVQQAQFFQLPAQLEVSSGGADRLQYQVSVEWGDSKHTVELSEAAMPDSLRPLIQHLERLLRTTR